MRNIFIICSIILLVLLVCIGGAEVVFRNAVTHKDLPGIKLAQRLDPLVSEYFYEEYRLTGDLEALQKAMDLEPTKPAYHMYYGLALMELPVRTRITDERAVNEICKAAALKPYSKLYCSTCDSFKKAVSQ
ncbi:MAG: hypothetical protein HQL17_08280 [Candidatus Omnitrophica bacterium]|nr:hypothetical protein [Candidatus Omnitrophota bacterium]